MSIVMYPAPDFPWAGAYYDQAPCEPCGAGQLPLPITTPVSVSHVSLESLLTVLTAGGVTWDTWGSGSSFLVVSHGTKEAIDISLFYDNTNHLSYDDLTALCAFDSPTFDVKKLAHRFRVPDWQMSTILTMISDFRKYSARHMAIRACNIGNNEKFLVKLAELLNVKQISAPLKRDFFSFIKPKPASSDELDKYAAAEEHHLQRTKKKALTIYGEKPNRLLLGFKDLPKHLVETHCLYESTTAVDNFFRDKFDLRKPVAFTPGKQLAVFGISRDTNDKVFPKDSEFSTLLKVIANPKFQMTDPPLPPLPMLPFDEPKKQGRLKRVLQKVFHRH